MKLFDHFFLHFFCSQSVKIYKKVSFLLINTDCLRTSLLTVPGRGGETLTKQLETGKETEECSHRQKCCSSDNTETINKCSLCDTGSHFLLMHQPVWPQEALLQATRQDTNEFYQPSHQKVTKVQSNSQPTLSLSTLGTYLHIKWDVSDNTDNKIKVNLLHVHVVQCCNCSGWKSVNIKINASWIKKLVIILITISQYFIQVLNQEKCYSYWTHNKNFRPGNW